MGGRHVIAKTIGCAMDCSYGDICFAVEPFKVYAMIFKDRVSGFLDFDIKVGSSEPKIIYLKRER